MGCVFVQYVGFDLVVEFVGQCGYVGCVDLGCGGGIILQCSVDLCGCQQCGEQGGVVCGVVFGNVEVGIYQVGCVIVVVIDDYQVGSCVVIG